MTELIKDQYADIVTTGEPAVVLFTSATCDPCKRIKPRMYELQDKLGFDLHVLDVSSEKRAVFKLRMRNVPAVVAIVNGEEKILCFGEHKTEDLERMLKASGVLGD